MTAISFKQVEVRIEALEEALKMIQEQVQWAKQCHADYSKPTFNGTTLCQHYESVVEGLEMMENIMKLRIKSAKHDLKFHQSLAAIGGN
jgi:hypothetical protein